MEAQSAGGAPVASSPKPVPSNSAAASAPASNGPESIAGEAEKPALTGSVWRRGMGARRGMPSTRGGA